MKHTEPVVADIASVDAPRTYKKARELALRIVKGIYPASKFGDGFTMLTDGGRLYRSKVVYKDPAPQLMAAARGGRNNRAHEPKPQQFFWLEVDFEERRRLAAYFETLARQLLEEGGAEEAPLQQ